MLNFFFSLSKNVKSAKIDLNYSIFDTTILMKITSF